MKITVSIGNIAEALKQVENYRDLFVKKQKLFLRRIAETGIEEATIQFKEAQYDGENDVVVHEPEWVNDNTIVVKASGSSILFIEFGTGVYYGTPVHEKAEEFGYERGGYGQHRGKYDFWFYQGDPGTNGEEPCDPDMAARGLIFTRGNPANRCMWEASKKMRFELLRIAKEVFG